MLWFSGTIRSAVEEVKSSGALFLIFIQGDDKVSRLYETFLSKAQCSPEDCLAIKILSGSRALNQFKAIYGNVPVPSVFLIGTNGIPLDVLSSHITSEGVNQAIGNAIEKATKHKINLSVVENEATVSEDRAYLPSSINSFQTHFYERNVTLTTIPKYVFLESCHDPPPWFLKQLKNLSARIQFRLPSNDTRSWEFPNMCTLHDVRLYLIEKVQLESGFKLFRTYPRIAFTPEDEKKTLSELSLTPSATLIVVPLRDEAVQIKIKRLIARPNLFSIFLASMIEPVLSLINYLRNWFHGRSSGDKAQKNVKITDSDESVGRTTNKKTSTSNIHGFRFDDSDTDTDTKTDNGNSTQQK